MHIKRFYCKHCQSEGPAACRPIPHFAHAMLTFLTCGMWAIGWVVAYNLGIGEHANCTRCGTKVK